MKEAIIYIHGKGGRAEEAEHYRALFPDCDVIGFDYKAQTPWEAREEFPAFYDAASRGHESVSVIANSIGAYFTMSALNDRSIHRALFVSPIVDMERLIRDMMGWASVTEEQLQREKEIATTFGETLSWDYLCYVRSHPLNWTVPTAILYGGRDNLTSRETVSAFAKGCGASLTVMESGEHWFHTEEQMAFLDQWIRKEIKL